MLLCETGVQSWENVKRGATTISTPDETETATSHTEFTWHMNLLWEQIKSRFADVDECLSKESRVMDPYISSLEDGEYLGREDEIADLHADLVSKKYLDSRCFGCCSQTGQTRSYKGYSPIRLYSTYLLENAFSTLVTIKTKALVTESTTRTLVGCH